MTLMWIGDLLLIGVVYPALLFVLITLMHPIRQIKAYAEDIAVHGSLFGPHLDALHQLDTTRALVKEVSGELERYCAALDRIR